MDNSVSFKIFSDCKIVKGLKSSLIYDLNRAKFYPLENKYVDLLIECNGERVSILSQKHTDSILLFLNKFVESDIGYYTDTPDLFPEINLNFKHPSKILSAILEVEKYESYDIPKVVRNLDKLGCKSLMIIIKKTNDLNFSIISNILDLLSDSFIVSLELIVPVDYKALFNEKVYRKNLRIDKILFYGSTKKSYSTNRYKINIFETTDLEFTLDEKILPEYFFTNVKMFSESYNYNLGLHRKICVTSEGVIKNFLTHESSFGHVDKVELIDVVDDSKFNYKWYISNDKISKCRNCKFRYCCVSNSDIYVDGGLYFKKEYCTYDIHVDEWS